VSRVVPVADDRSAPFWEAAARHQLVLARCDRCGQLSHPPDVVCPRCHAPDSSFTFEPVSGAGVIRSWIVVQQSFLPGFDDGPFRLVDVALDDDPEVRLIGRLLDGPQAGLEMGGRVVGAFEDIADGVALPAFRLDR
jgi:uncharacterized protein